jgi:hypothetical protein
MTGKITNYIVLAIILALGVASFIYVRPDTTMQLVIGIATSIAYVCWGLIYHALEKNLHAKVVVEYVLIGAIAIVLLITIIGT